MDFLVPLSLEPRECLVIKWLLFHLRTGAHRERAVRCEDLASHLVELDRSGSLRLDPDLVVEREDLTEVVTPTLDLELDLLLPFLGKLPVLLEELDVVRILGSKRMHLNVVPRRTYM